MRVPARLAWHRLGRVAWNEGYATEASRALIDRGFTDFGVQRVLASTMVVNRASQRVLAKAGLTFRRILQRDWPEPIAGDELGETEYALTRAEWSRTASRGLENA